MGCRSPAHLDGRPAREHGHAARDLSHGIAANERRAVRTNERIAEASLERVEALANELLSAVEDEFGVLVARAKHGDACRIDEADGSALVNGDHSGRCSRRSGAPLRAIDRANETLGTDRLRKEIDGVEIERVGRVLHVRGREDDRRKTCRSCEVTRAVTTPAIAMTFDVREQSAFTAWCTLTPHTTVMTHVVRRHRTTGSISFGLPFDTNSVIAGAKNTSQ